MTALAPQHGVCQVRLRIPRNRDALTVVPFEHAVAAARAYRQGAQGRAIAATGLDPAMVRGRAVFIGSSAAILGDYAHVPVQGRLAGLGILALAYANLKHDLVLKSARWEWNLALLLLAAVLPLLITNRADGSELATSLTAAGGIAAATALHIVLYGKFAQTSELPLAYTTGIAVLLIQLSLRVRGLYEDRRRLHFEKLSADQANALKTQFLSHMTQELRTPLTAIMGYNRLLAEDVRGADEEMRGRLDIVDQNCHHLLQLINNLLDQAKIEAGQMEIAPSVVGPRALVEQVASTLRALADEKGVTWRVNCHEGLPHEVHVDELRLRQILLNLCGNALKFTEDGSILIEASWRDGRLRLAVTDTGPGMSQEAVGRIFEAFEQAETTTAQTHGGTGLGLTVSRNLAQLMNGDLSVESTLGQGSCFSLEIEAPFVARTLAPPEEPPAAKPALADASVGITGTILVVDDTPDLRDLVGLHLRRAGASVLVAENGEEALVMALEAQPALILMDIQMPVMNGLEAIRALRAADYTGTVIALTAHDEIGAAERIQEAGFDGQLTKPIRKERLLEAARLYLTRPESAALADS